MGNLNDVLTSRESETNSWSVATTRQGYKEKRANGHRPTQIKSHEKKRNTE